MSCCLFMPESDTENSLEDLQILLPLNEKKNSQQFYGEIPENYKWFLKWLLIRTHHQLSLYSHLAYKRTLNNERSYQTPTFLQCLALKNINYYNDWISSTTILKHRCYLKYYRSIYSLLCVGWWQIIGLHTARG